MDPIMQLAEEKGIYVIEDCAQAHGAYKGNPQVQLGILAHGHFAKTRS
jgi:dTDP-4-amino-4,6-dideoxygalactose transaminase